MKIRNFTPHAINICNNAGEVIRTIQPDGLVRLKMQTESFGEIDGVPITGTTFGEPEGLPGFEHGNYYIVSQIVKSALVERTDLLVPAELVRDDKGSIVGCKSLGI